MKITLSLEDVDLLISIGQVEKDGTIIVLDKEGHNVGFSFCIAHSSLSPGSPETTIGQSRSVGESRTPASKDDI